MKKLFKNRGGKILTSLVLASLLAGTSVLAESLNVSYDSDKKDSITLANSGATISNVNDGYVLAGSKYAVNGGQLYEIDCKINDLHMDVNNFMNTTNNSLVNLTSWLAGDGTEDGKGVATKASTAYTAVKTGFNLYVNGNTNNNVHLGLDNYGVNFIAGDNVSIDTKGSNGIKFSVLVDGKVEIGNTGLVSGDTVYQAISGLSTSSNPNSVIYDDDSHETITLKNTRITGLVDGNVIEGSTDAITAGQFYTKNKHYETLFNSMDERLDLENQSVLNLAATTASLVKDTGEIGTQARVAYNFLTGDGFGVNINGKQIGKLNYANTEFNFTAGDNISISSTSGNIAGIKISAVANGKVETGNTGLVTGGMVKEAISLATEGIATDANIANKADKDLANLSTVGTDKISKIASDAAKTEVAGKADFDAGNIDITAWQTKLDTVKKDGSNIDLGAWQSLLGNGINAEGNTGLITGDTLNKALATVKGTTYTGSDTITIGDDNSISVKVNGKVEDGNTGLVTGAQVKEAITKATENMATDETLKNKADTKLSNITEEGKQVIKDTVKADLDKKADQSYVDNQVKGLDDKLTTKADISYVDTKVSDAVQDKVTKAELEEGLAKKTDTDLSNITEAGKQVIKDTVKADLDKKADKSYVDDQVKGLNDKLATKADTSYVDNKITDAVKDKATKADLAKKADQTYVDDQVKGLDNKLATKADISYVDDAVKDKATKTELADGLATKANGDASNLTDDNVKSWAGKLGIGTVAENDTNLVTGDAVYKAISQVDANNGMLAGDDKTISVGKNSEAASVDFTNAKGEQRVLTGIKTDVSDDTSAANVGFVKDSVEGVYQNVGTAMNSMYSRVNKDMSKGVAGASALAALKPLDYDPNDKMSFAVGYGHYKGANATALGAFYRPNDDTMVNVGASLGNGSNAVNAGVSFKLGKGSAYNGLSKAQLAAAVVEQEKKIASLEKDNEELKAKLEEILAKLK